MAILTHGSPNFRTFCEREGSLFLGISAAPVLPQRVGVYGHFVRERGTSRRLLKKELCNFPGKGSFAARNVVFTVPRDSSSSNTSSSGKDDPPNQSEQTPFGYTRKDVLFIGLGITILGFGLKSGLEFAGYDPMQAGNVVQLVLVLGLTLGWISTYMFRVSNKDMTYAQQLRDYEDKVMQKRLESLTEAELVALLEQVEEEKSQSGSGEQVN